MEIGYPSTRVVNSGSGNRALSCSTRKENYWLSLVIKKPGLPIIIPGVKDRLRVVSATKLTYIMAPRSTANHGFAVDTVTAQLPAIRLVTRLPSVANTAGNGLPYCQSSPIWYAGLDRAALHSPCSVKDRKKVYKITLVEIWKLSATVVWLCKVHDIHCWYCSMAYFTGNGVSLVSELTGTREVQTSHRH